MLTNWYFVKVNEFFEIKLKYTVGCIYKYGYGDTVYFRSTPPQSIWNEIIKMCLNWRLSTLIEGFGRIYCMSNIGVRDNFYLIQSQLWCLINIWTVGCSAIPWPDVCYSLFSSFTSSRYTVKNSSVTKSVVNCQNEVQRTVNACEKANKQYWLNQLFATLKGQEWENYFLVEENPLYSSWLGQEHPLGGKQPSHKKWTSLN